MNHPNNHLQNEDLSAYLDHALPYQEYIAAQRHLQTCDRCAYQLTQFKMTVELLRRAKVMTVPRNFTLDNKLTARKPARTSPWQLFSAAAAILGITLLLFGAYAYINVPNETAAGLAANVTTSCGTINCPASSSPSPTTQTTNPKKPTGVTTLPVHLPTATTAPAQTAHYINQRQIAWWIYGVLAAGLIFSITGIISIALFLRR